MRGKFIALGGIILILLGAHLFSIENPSLSSSVQADRGKSIRVVEWFDALRHLLIPE